MSSPSFAAASAYSPSSESSLDPLTAAKLVHQLAAEEGEEEDDETLTLEQGGAMSGYNIDGELSGEGGAQEDQEEDQEEEVIYPEEEILGDDENGYAYDDEYADEMNASNLSLVSDLSGDEGAGWYETYVFGLDAPCSQVAFDKNEEVLWTATSNGRVSSFLSPSMQRHVSFASAPPGYEIKQLSVEPSVVVSLSDTSLRVHSKGGIPASQKFYYEPPASVLSSGLDPSLTSFAYKDLSHKQVVISTANGTLLSVDLQSNKLMMQEQMSQQGVGIVSVKSARNILCCGESGGNIALRDPRTLKLTNTLRAHSGAVSDMDLKGDYLLTCGYSDRFGALYNDPFIRLFDVRMNRQVSQTLFPSGATLLRFHPLFSSVYLVASSQTANFQLRDCQMESNASILFQIPSAAESGAMIRSIDMSSSGEALAFGDDTGGVHVWTPSSEFLINPTSVPTEVPEPPTFEYNLDEDSPLGVVPVPITPYKPASDWPFQYQRVFPRLVKEVRPEILRMLRTVDFIGHAINPGLRRVQEGYISSSGSSSSSNSGYGSSSSHSLSSPNMMSPASAGGSVPSFNNLSKMAQGKRLLISNAETIPPAYDFVEVKHSRIGWDDFDFASYNSSKFCGLDNTMPNSYCNAVLQSLYHFPMLRVAMMNHLCRRHHCLSCELGFLFYMMERSPGGCCQPANFLRSFRQMKEAAALGIFVGYRGIAASEPAVRVVNFHRFLLDQLHKENIPVLAGAPNMPPQVVAYSNIKGHPTLGPDVVNDMFGCEIRTVSRCSHCGAEQQHDGRTMIIDLASPSAITGSSHPTTFAHLIRASLRKESKARAWCAACSVYRATDQTRHLLTLPPVLTFTVPNNEADLKWIHSLGSSSSSSSSSSSAKPSTPSAAPAPVFAQPKPRLASESPSISIASASSSSASPAPSPQTLPLGFSLYQDQASTEWQLRELNAAELVKATQSDAKNDRNGLLTYELRAVVFQAKKSYVAPSEGHLQSYVRSPESAPILSGKVPATAGAGAGNMAAPKAAAGVKTPSPPSSASGSVSPLAPSPVSSSASPPPSLVDSSSPPSSSSPPPPSFSSPPPLSPMSPNNNNGNGNNGNSNAWFHTNDFTIKSVPASEVLDYSQPWKTPCILYYARVGLEKRVPPAPYRNPITDRVFAEESAIMTRPKSPLTFMPLRPDEALRPNDRVAIDAEFVALNPEESEFDDSGTRVVTKAPVLCLARVSVVRANRSAFIDDYIATSEPIADYLTKYSGVKPGDLDPTLSKHHVVPLKSAYIKLRWLIDRGVSFVGHGLSKDFKIINIVVPKEQIIDTVEIFHYPKHRKISLKFLSQYLLNADIQKDTHCSIEDARSALDLHNKYLELAQADQFDEVLAEVYEVGRSRNWQV